MLRALVLPLLALLLVAQVGRAQAPSEADLGVPFYPGARYEAATSKGLSQPSEKYYVFTTADALSKVQAFYEAAAKRKAVASGDGGAVILVLEGAAPFPKHGIVIEPNRPGMYPATVRTVFTIRRELPSDGDSPSDTTEDQEADSASADSGGT
jgi:hypothetical protein